MMTAPKITFIGAGSTIFVKNILGDVFHREALKTAHIALMDIDPTRLEESHIVVRKLMDSAGASGKITCHTQQKEALQDADFVVVAFQIGGYEPCTVTDFEVCKRHGLEQTIADTLGPGGIMRALRTIPHLWQICEDMTEVCPDATMLNYVNPMAMNTWAMYARYPHIKQVGLCHSVQGTAEELARDLNIDPATLRYRCAGINHMAFYLELALLLSVVASLCACGASGVAGGSLLLIPLACNMFGISNDIAMQVVAVGFIIGVLQDSCETALNSSTDVLFTAAACQAEDDRLANSALRN